MSEWRFSHTDRASPVELQSGIWQNEANRFHHCTSTKPPFFFRKSTEMSVFTSFQCVCVTLLTLQCFEFPSHSTHCFLLSNFICVTLYSEQKDFQKVNELDIFSWGSTLEDVHLLFHDKIISATRNDFCPHILHPLSCL